MDFQFDCFDFIFWFNVNFETPTCYCFDINEKSWNICRKQVIEVLKSKTDRIKYITKNSIFCTTKAMLQWKIENFFWINLKNKNLCDSLLLPTLLLVGGCSSDDLDSLENRVLSVSVIFRRLLTKDREPLIDFVLSFITATLRVWKHNSLLIETNESEKTFFRWWKLEMCKFPFLSNSTTKIFDFHLNDKWYRFFFLYFVE